MNRIARKILLVIAAAEIAGSASLLAQSATTPVPPPCECRTAPRVVNPGPAYSATTTTTRVQKLADGTTITHVDTGFVARDAEGRVRNETVRMLADGTSVHTINVSDPTRNTRFYWTSGNPNAAKTVTLYHYDIQPAQPRPVTATPAARRYYPTRSESLPPMTIEGIYVEGYRNYRTTPAGYDGNNADITMTTETWTSPDLRISLRQINDDPRYGKTTTELTNIQQAAPDPALFRAPDGYQIKESTPSNP